MRDIIECIPGAATPMNTLGMGTVEPCVTDPIPTTSCKRKKRRKRRMKHLKDIIIEKLKINNDRNLVEYIDFCDYTTCVNLLSKIDDREFLPVCKKVFDPNDTIYNYAFAVNDTDDDYPGCTHVGDMFDKLKCIGDYIPANEFIEKLFGYEVADIQAFEYENNILLEILIKLGPDKYINTYNVFSNNADFKMEAFKHTMLSEYPALVESTDDYSMLQLYNNHNWS